MHVCLKDGRFARRRLIVAGLLAGFAAAGLGDALIGASSASATTPLLSWSAPAPVDPVANYAMGISCVSTLVCVAPNTEDTIWSTSAASGGSAPRVGYYAPLGSSSGSALVELSVIDGGKQVSDKATAAGIASAALACDLDPAEEAEGLNPGAAFVVVYLPPGLTLPINGRKFSYSGPAYLAPDETAGVTQPAGTITIDGTFKPASAVKGKKFNDFVVAFKGTVSATLCPTSPTTFNDYWSKNNL
ncbi:MAG: hypothetical protein ABSC56_05650 [Solirubrobacteraceae bacterium]|jgi:hypothetical protein